MSDDQIKVELLRNFGNDLDVVNAARVSFDKQSKWAEEPVVYSNGEDAVVDGKYVLSEKDTKLIHYLAKHKHYSPFGHCFARLRITAPVFVCRQLVKHEYLRMNEVSRRYVDTPPEFYTPDMWRGRAVDKKQGSNGIVDLSRYYVKMGTTLNTDIEGTLRELVTGVTSLTSQLYDVVVANGVAPEQARMILPLSMMTSWWWSGSLDAFANMCKLRLKEDTQYETRLVAQQISEYMSDLYPVSWGALINETD
jgi:thymidylate synthase (FAD)